MVLVKPYLTSQKRIANWWFEDRSTLITVVGIDELTDLLAMCEKCLSVLGKHRLLIPVNIIFSKTWMYYNEQDECAEAIQKNQITVAFPNNESIRDLLLPRVLAEQTEKGFTFPANIEVKGNGIIVDGRGNEIIVPDVMSIEALFMGAPVIDVSTNSYAWLPYTLSGEEQKEVYINNASRLEHALNEIERVLGVESVSNDYSKYCNINGYKLDNFRDDEDTPLAVGELGGILES